MNSVSVNGTRRVAAVAMFTALAISTDYAMLPLANVKLMDSIVFIAALTFGVSAGASVAALTWLVYGTINPLGPDTGPFLLLLIASEMIYVLFGYVARRMLRRDQSVPARSLLWGSFGLIGAFLYDFNTIVTPYLVIGEPVKVIIPSLLFASPFMLAHEISDFVFFSTVAPLLYIAVRKVALRQRNYAEVPVSSVPLEPKDV